MLYSAYKMTPFIHLHCRTSYSLLTSLLSPKMLFDRAKELEQPAIAITDTGTLAACYDGLRVSRETGVKLIIGADFYFLDSINNPEKKLRFIVLIAKNAVGYKNLLLLNRAGYNSNISMGKRVIPVIDWKLLKQYSEGLLCLTGDGNGIVAQVINNKRFDDAESILNKLLDIFGESLGVEVQAHNLVKGKTNYTDAINQVFTNTHLIRLATKLNIPIIPTTTAQYLKREDAETHDVMLAIGAMQPVYSNARTKYNVPDLYIKSGDEIKAFFTRSFGEAFATEICNNTIKFADMCEVPEWIDPKFSNPTGKELPIFPVEQEADLAKFKFWMITQPSEVKVLDVDKAYLRYKCQMPFSKKVPKGKEQEYNARLKEELEVLEYKGFSSYMLIVADYINWAKNNGIRIGVGRGSVCGSLVAYLLNIHEADPIKYGLIFARFINKERNVYPDIDSDIAPSGRVRLQEYIRNKYGQDHVAHVSNINTITPKVFARDIARSCEIGGSREAAVNIGNLVADSIPKRIGEHEIKTYKEAIDKAPLFVEWIKQYDQYKKHSAICGKPRAWATHAGGIVISGRPLTEFIPLRKDKDDAIAIEFDKNTAEENGLVKMDTLGIETLDIIDEVYKQIEKVGKPLPPDPLDYDEYDKATYDLISRGDTLGVFQLGISGGTIDLCKKVRPKSINDISHINALARPSCRAIRDGFIKAKEGKQKVKLLHPSLERAFGWTYGYGLYEESLMYLAQDVAGWTLHEADRLRKLTKEKGKNPKKALQWRSDFIEDSKRNNNIDKSISMKIWDEVIENFGNYGFNQSHSIAYSMIGYHTAYLKAHYPIEFLMANLMYKLRSNQKTAEEGIENIKQELRNKGMKIIPPNINKSGMSYQITEDGSLLTGLEALKFVSPDAIKDILEKRPFISFDDFMRRVNSKYVRSNAIQAMAASGCLDQFGISRKLMYLYCADYRKKLQVWIKKNNEPFVYPWPVIKDWTLSEQFALERSYLGEAFICSKKEAYTNFFNSKSVPIKDIKEMSNKENIPFIKAEVKNIFEFKVKKETSKFLGKEMVKAVIEDEFGDQIGLTIFPDRWENIKRQMKEYRHGKYKFSEGLAIYFAGTLNVYEDDVGIILESMFDVCPPPPLPGDLKARKISMKNKRIDKVLEQMDLKTDVNEYIENIEDSLFDEGLIDLNEDDEDDDICSNGEV
jgi:DNA polymerase III subunit alpha